MRKVFEEYGPLFDISDGCSIESIHFEVVIVSDIEVRPHRRVGCHSGHLSMG